MSIESTADRAGLREVGRITRMTLDLLEARLRPGVTTGALDEAAAALVAAHGAASAPARGFPNDYRRSQRDILTDGLVLTIEPMISAGSTRVFQDADGWTLRTCDGSLAAHCEQTIVVTARGAVVLAA